MASNIGGFSSDFSDLTSSLDELVSEFIESELTCEERNDGLELRSTARGAKHELILFFLGMELMSSLVYIYPRSSIISSFDSLRSWHRLSPPLLRRNLTL